VVDNQNTIITHQNYYTRLFHCLNISNNPSAIVLYEYEIMTPTGFGGLSVSTNITQIKDGDIISVGSNDILKIRIAYCSLDQAYKSPDSINFGNLYGSDTYSPDETLQSKYNRWGEHQLKPSTRNISDGSYLFLTSLDYFGGVSDWTEIDINSNYGSSTTEQMHSLTLFLQRVSPFGNNGSENLFDYTLAFINILGDFAGGGGGGAGI